VALRRKVSKSAIVEAKVMSYLSGDSADRLETVMSRRLDKLGRQIDMLDLDLAAAYGSRTIRCPRQRRGAVRGLHAESRPASGDGRQVPQRDVARHRLTSRGSIAGRVREQRRSRVSIQANPVYWRLPPIAAAA